MGIERLVEGSIGPAFAIASDGRIVAVNTAAAELTGQPAHELLNQYCGDVVSALDGVGKRLCRPEGCPTLEALAGGQPTDLPWCSWQTPDGTHLPLSATAVAIPGDARPDSTAALILLHLAGAPAASKEVDPAGAAGEIHVRLFGRPECTRDGAVQPVPRRRAFELLALLAFAGNRGLARERICEILWPDPSGGSERTHLRVLLHTLRQSLGREVTETVDPDDRGRLRLATDIAVDIVAFERGATALQQCDPATHLGADAEGRLREIDTLLSLYVGDLDEAA
ncbi:MAG: PAS domain-containing protein, partial [Dehalococcoidia bacterium]|nr:PAS domain-containing protein [Dehalococcoidia bacterium]